MTINIPDNKIEDYAKAVNKGIIALSDVQTAFFFWIEESSLSSAWLKWKEKTGYTSDQCYEEIKKSLDILNELQNEIDKKSTI